MNKKINLYLNITESILIFLLVGIGTIIYINNVHTSMLGRNLIITGCFILEFLLISIELFVFYNIKKKYRLATILFYLIDMILMMVLASKIPFYGIVFFLGLNLVKNGLRVMKLEEIKDLDQFYKFCDIFHIKVKKTRKKTTTKKVVATTKKETTKKSVSTTKAKTTKSKGTTSKETSKSYA
jgi:hypothetical protein